MKDNPTNPDISVIVLVVIQSIAILKRNYTSVAGGRYLLVMFS
ncbi:hypothetical protein GGGNBK_16590 [Sporosarcina sp. ANT_H38]